MYRAITKDIAVTVEPVFLQDDSAPDSHYFVWAYEVSIENAGAAPVTLRARYWHITDALGRISEVRGPGVVGEQPNLAPGECFTYRSGTPLTTPSGIMRGSYEMETVDGDRFEVEIPPFSLDSPHQAQTCN